MLSWWSQPHNNVTVTPVSKNLSEGIVVRCFNWHLKCLRDVAKLPFVSVPLPQANRMIPVECLERYLREMSALCEHVVLRNEIAGGPSPWTWSWAPQKQLATCNDFDNWMAKVTKNEWKRQLYVHLLVTRESHQLNLMPGRKRLPMEAMWPMLFPCSNIFGLPELTFNKTKKSSNRQEDIAEPLRLTFQGSPVVEKQLEEARIVEVETVRSNVSTPREKRTRPALQKIEVSKRQRTAVCPPRVCRVKREPPADQQSSQLQYSLVERFPEGHRYCAMTWKDKPNTPLFWCGIDDPHLAPPAWICHSAAATHFLIIKKEELAILGYVQYPRKKLALWLHPTNKLCKLSELTNFEVVASYTRDVVERCKTAQNNGQLLCCSVVDFLKSKDVKIGTLDWDSNTVCSACRKGSKKFN